MRAPCPTVSDPTQAQQDTQRPALLPECGIPRLTGFPSSRTCPSVHREYFPHGPQSLHMLLKVRFDPRQVLLSSLADEETKAPRGAGLTRTLISCPPELALPGAAACSSHRWSLKYRRDELKGTAPPPGCWPAVPTFVQEPSGQGGELSCPGTALLAPPLVGWPRRGTPPGQTGQASHGLQRAKGLGSPGKDMV